MIRALLFKLYTKQLLHLKPYSLGTARNWGTIRCTVESAPLMGTILLANFLSALKSGQVTWVIRVWNLSGSDLDWIMCDTKLRNMWCGGATMQTYVLHEPRSPFVIVLLVSISAWKPHPCFVCVCMRKTQPFIGPCPSIDCGCRL